MVLGEEASGLEVADLVTASDMGMEVTIDIGDITATGEIILE